MRQVIQYGKKKLFFLYESVSRKDFQLKAQESIQMESKMTSNRHGGHTKDSADVNELFTKYYLAGRLWLVDALFVSVVLYPETKDKKTKVEATSFSVSLSLFFSNVTLLNFTTSKKKKKKNSPSLSTTLFSYLLFHSVFLLHCLHNSL